MTLKNKYFLTTDHTIILQIIIQIVNNRHLR
jgi:hypothetical protein